jgi:aspartyl-tRNA synthetase
MAVYRWYTALARTLQRSVSNIHLPSSEEINRFTMRSHTCGELCKIHDGKTVKLCGWVCGMRKMSSKGPLFIPLRDSYGTTQLIVTDKAAIDQLSNVPLESILCAKGRVQLRPENMRNKVCSSHLPSANCIATVMSGHENWRC